MGGIRRLIHRSGVLWAEFDPMRYPYAILGFQWELSVGGPTPLKHLPSILRCRWHGLIPSSERPPDRHQSLTCGLGGFPFTVI